MIRWLVAGLLLSACHQPGPPPARPPRSPNVGATTDAAHGVRKHANARPPGRDSHAELAELAITPARPAAAVVAATFPPKAELLTHAGAQRTLVIQPTGLELWSNTPPQKIATLLDTEARDISFSPAGDMAAAAVCTNNNVMDCTIWFFSSADGSVVRTVAVPILDNAQFSATGHYYLYSNQTGLYVLNMATAAVAAHRENGDATHLSAYGGLEDGIEGNASAGWPGVVRVLDDRLVRSSQGLVELTDLLTGKVLARHLYKGVGPFAHLLLDQQDLMLTFDAAHKALFIWHYPPVGQPHQRRAVPPKKIALYKLITEVCNDCQLSTSSRGSSIIVLESNATNVAIVIDLATGTATRSVAMRGKTKGS